MTVSEGQQAALAAVAAGQVRKGGGLPAGVFSSSLQACHRRGWVDVNHVTGVHYLTDPCRRARDHAARADTP